MYWDRKFHPYFSLGTQYVTLKVNCRKISFQFSCLSSSIFALYSSGMSVSVLKREFSGTWLSGCGVNGVGGGPSLTCHSPVKHPSLSRNSPVTLKSPNTKLWLKNTSIEWALKRLQWKHIFLWNRKKMKPLISNSNQTMNVYWGNWKDIQMSLTDYQWIFFIILYSIL